MSKPTQEAYDKLEEVFRRGGGRLPQAEEAYAMEIGYAEGYKQALADQNTPVAN